MAMGFMKYFVLFGGIYLLLILTIDVYFLNSLGFGQNEVLVALVFPILFGWVLGGIVPERHWGAYFSLSWIMLLLAVFAIRVGKNSTTDHEAIAFVIFFATGCMFAVQSLRMLIHLDQHERE